MGTEKGSTEPDAAEGRRLRQELQSTVKRYFEDKGFGFFLRPDATDLFFHASNLQCSRPYEGEVLCFDLGKDKLGREVAVSIHRPSSPLATGDIVDWTVDPGTRRAEGTILPRSGGDPIRFSGFDLLKTLGPEGRQINPRPWHAASYKELVLSDGSRRAVDIQIDWRYPLHRFAYLDDEEELVRSLKSIALDENWDYRTSQSKKPHEILYNYLHYTFAKLVDEDRGREPLQRKIRIRDDLKDHTPLAAFNTGLVDKRYESIFALFERNDPGRQQSWKLLAFCIAGEGAGKLLSHYFNPLPGPAQYFSHTAELLYDPDAPMHPDYTHIMNENRDRLPAELLKLVEPLDAIKAANVLKMHLDRSIDLARKRARWNFKTAIPHYFPSFKRLDFLLPLSLLDDFTVDVALAVQRTEKGYLGNTILPLDWAYKSARLVCRPDSDWLAPERIDAVAGTRLDEPDVE
jgi:cold shock CspA family protein